MSRERSSSMLIRYLEVEVYVNQVIKSMPATKERLEEIRMVTEKDEELQAVKDVVINGWPEVRSKCSEKVCQYWVHRGEITYLRGLLLKDHRTIVPYEMRRKLLEEIHEGHPGMTKCMRRARQSVFWPGINNKIKMLIEMSNLLENTTKQVQRTNEGSRITYESFAESRK